jgi:glycerate kinase
VTGVLADAITVLIAPDSFKGSASASDIAEALAAGWKSVRSDDHIVLAPMADGGEGTLDAFRSANPSAQLRSASVTGPDGRSVDAPWLMLPDSTALIELASSSGIGLMRELDPLGAHTLGFGQTISAALDTGATRLILALGSSASTEGGVGALTAMGARFADAKGAPVALGGHGLASIASVDLSNLPPLPPGGVRVLTDVTNPLLGPDGAAAVYGPQKGATPEDIATLESGLRQLLRVIGRPDAPGAGAAGGLGYGLQAWGATLTSGAAAVGTLLGLPALADVADVIITGEGRYDAQSAAGKVPSYVAGLSRGTTPLIFLTAGEIIADIRGFSVALELSELAGNQAAALRNASLWARAAGARLARIYPAVRR